MAGTNYTIDYSDSTLTGKTPFTIESGTLNSTTSLYLFGQGYLRYGEYANENFVKLLENFASRNSPARPTMGQLWYDGNTNTLKVYNNTNTWVELGGSGGTGTGTTYYAGSGITINGTTISVTKPLPATGGTIAGQMLYTDGSAPYWGNAPAGSGGTTYTQGTGITISGTQISVTKPLPATGGTIAGQMLYTDGSAPYWGNAPSGTGTTYTQGDGITISSGVISVAANRSVPVGGIAGDVLTKTMLGGVTWSTPTSGGGTGTVTSVALSGGSTGLTVTGSPITTSGSMSLGGMLGIGYGGTGASSAATALSNLGGIPINNVSGTQYNTSVGFTTSGNKNFTAGSDVWKVGMGVTASGTSVGCAMFGINESVSPQVFGTGNYSCGVFGTTVATSGSEVLGVYGNATNASTGKGVLGIGQLCGLWGDAHAATTTGAGKGIVGFGRNVGIEAHSDYSGTMDLVMQSTYTVGNLIFGGTGGAGGSTYATRFRVDRLGNTYGLTFNTSGADFAEYFEWFDLNSSNEDRIGLCVVSSNENKVELFDESQHLISDIIGVVSGNAGVLGNDADLRWTGQYTYDDFGRLLYDDVEVFTWSTTNAVIQTNEVHSHTTESALAAGVEIPTDAIRSEIKVPRPNPNYNPDLTYVPRSERPEWAVIGLLGQVWIKHGQPIKPEWVSLHKSNTSAELYLIK